MRRSRESLSIPEFVLDLSTLTLPAHLPRTLSSLQFPHRNGDAYLRDAAIDGEDFLDTELGQSVFGATVEACGPLMAWFPQALLYGFWQSHLGKKRQNTKHARAWVSEIVGWRPASVETRLMGLKGGPGTARRGTPCGVPLAENRQWPATSYDHQDLLRSDLAFSIPAADKHGS